ncbi:MAG: dipeptidase [Candidatus Aminicenantes bacterium]
MRSPKFARSALAAAVGLGLCLAGCRAPAAKTVEQRALDLHRRMLTVDTHCDTPFNLLRTDWKIGDRHDGADRRSGKIDLPRMREGGLDAEFFAAFVGQGPRTPEGYGRAKDRALQAIDAVRKMTVEYADQIGLALIPDDARRLKKEGLLSAFIGMENGYPLGLDASLVESFFDLGVRYITLCHSSDNDICDSSTDRRDPQDNGLSDFGRKIVEECNRVGMMVDISHASDKSFFDVLAVTKAPVIASHSSSRAVCDNPRNLSDDMLRALARNGGVIQICFLSAYVKAPVPNPERDAAMKALEVKYGPLRAVQDEALRAQAMAEREAIYREFPPDRATVADLVDHIDHVKKVIGVDYVGIGTDFDGGGGVDGCDDVSGMIHVTEELIRRGYRDREIEKIWGGNFIRVFQKNLDLAGR